MRVKNINRRSFLKMSAMAGAGAALVRNDVRAAANPFTAPAYAQQKIEMPYRTLGRTGLKVPILSMGVMRADNPNVVKAAYNSGIVHFDTAHGYQQGKNEVMLGEFFADKPRDSFIIATKEHYDYPNEGFEGRFMDQFDLSLERLKMKYVDILYLHGVRDVEQLEDKRILDLVKQLKDSGKAHFVGFSTHAGKPEQLIKAAEVGAYDVILVSYNFKLKNLEETNAAIAKAAEAGIGIVAMKTMAGGTEGPDRKKIVNAQACLKWAWKNENITTIIPGFTSFDELDKCIAAVQSPELTDEESKYLASLRDCEMLYCQQCEKCLAQCPENLPIPDMMRAYMYAYGYNYARMTKETLASLNLPANVCSSCKDGCKVACPSGFRVGDKIAAIMPVMNVPDALLT